MLSRTTNNRTGHRLWAGALIVVLTMGFIAISAPMARASETSSAASETGKPDTPAAPQIPDTVIVPDPVTLSVVLPKTGTIRQLVFNIWLEASSKSAVPVIEQKLPKVINAFLVDLQRLMYHDTRQRFETREPGKRGFKYTGPDLLPPPPPKTEEELAAEAEAAEAAAENGEEIVKEPPFSPFQPVTNRYFAALQNKLLRTGQGILPPDTLRSVQVRMFYDFWPGDSSRGAGQ